MSRAARSPRTSFLSTAIGASSWGRSARVRASVALGVVATSGAVALSGAALPGCKKPANIDFVIDLPAGVRDQTTWFELGAFRGTSCARIAGQISGGIPDDGVTKRLAFRSDDATPPAIGVLPRDQYAFAAVAKADDCGVLATGCTDVDAKQTPSTIHVALTPLDAPIGACAAGSVCDAARCVPAVDNSNPTVGAGCSLELLGAGPLADPMSTTGGEVSAPAVVATPSGFLVAYREYDPYQGSARLTMIPVDTGGGALPPQTVALHACVTDEESDATAALWQGANGLVAVSRGPCGGSGGIDLFSVAPDGTVAKSGFSGSPGARPLLSTAHALAPRQGAGYFVAFTEGDQATVATGSDVALSNQSAAFGGATPHTDAWVAASDKVLALLAAAGPTTGGASDGGLEGGPPAATGATLRLQVAPANADLAALPAPSEIPGTWGSVAAQGGRVIVASDGNSAGKPVVWRVYDLGGSDPSASDGFTTEGLGKVLYADVAFHQDHMFFAVERPGSISLVAYNHATTTPAFLRQLTMGADPRLPSLARVNDGRVAVAASDTRVAVAWTTAKTLTTNDAVGGYAVYACTTP